MKTRFAAAAVVAVLTTTLLVTSALAVPSIINSSLDLTALSGTFDSISDPPNATGGTFTVTATFTNISADSFTGVFSETTTLGGPGCACVILNRTGGPAGVGSTLSADLGPDSLLTPGESFTLVYDVGLTTPSPFDFFVDILGELSGVSGVAPTAVDDSYDALGNVQISVPADGVLGNDTDPDAGDTKTVTEVNGVSADVGVAITLLSGATLTLSADGSFDYDPPPGFEATDTFAYTVEDMGGLTDTGMVTITVADMIWFIDNTGGGSGGSGTLNDPFKRITDFNSSLDPDPGDGIFLDETGTDYTDGITLKTDQTLIGEGATVPLDSALGITVPPFSLSLPATGGTRPEIDNSSGNGIDLDAGNTIRGLDIGDTSGTGILGSSVGTLTISEASIDNTTGGGVDIMSGTLAVTFDSLSASSSAVEGIVLSSVTGTFSVSDGTISTTGVPAVDISGTGAGLAGTVTLDSVSTDGGTLGISLSNITGTFTVTGSGTTDGSGGTIENIVDGDGIRLDDTDGLVTLKNMIIEDISATSDASSPINTRSGVDAIHGEDVNGGLTLDNVIIRRISDNAINGALFSDGLSATVWDGLVISNSLIENTNRFDVAGRGDDDDEGMVRILGIKGTVIIEDSTLQDGGELVDFSTDASGTLDMTVKGSDFNRAYKEFTSGSIAKVGKICLDVTINGSLAADITVGALDETTVSEGNAFLNCGTASLRLGHDSGASGDLNTVISQNTFRVDDHSSTLGTAANFPQGGVNLRPRGTADMDAIVSNNTFGTGTAGSTSDEIMNADGGLGNLALILEGGSHQVRVSDNTFNGPINAPWFIRADGNSSAAVLFRDNVYNGDPAFFSPDPGFGSFRVPGIPYRTRVKNGGALDLTFENDQFAVHDQFFFTLTETAEFEVLAIGGGGTLNLALDTVTSPDGFEFKESAGTLNLYQGSVNDAATGPCTAGSTSDCQDELADDGNRGGPTGFVATGTPDATLNPPFVDVDAGSIAIVGTAPTLPSGTVIGGTSF